MADDDRRSEWDRHNLSVKQQLPDGRWTKDQAEWGQGDVLFRVACTCGWVGRKVDGPDSADAEAAYDDWDETHVPDWDLRSQGG